MASRRDGSRFRLRPQALCRSTRSRRRTAWDVASLADALEQTIVNFLQLGCQTTAGSQVKSSDLAAGCHQKLAGRLAILFPGSLGAIHDATTEFFLNGEIALEDDRLGS